MPRSTKAASDRRLEFINAAEFLFNDKGFENTSIDDIVQKVGVAKGLFYYYFKSREELLAAIVDRILAEMEQIVVEAINMKGLTAMERLSAMSPPSDVIKARGGKLMQYFHEERNHEVPGPSFGIDHQTGGGGGGFRYSVSTGDCHCIIRIEERHRPQREGH
jgi:AcrR family transcriptional regulator